ncbi:MAG: VanZ family protein [Lachnospiraceae bacterium]|jgi:VanZ family protein|nr:VanZ family protein [Lachnospiraceae bacterium]
MKNRECVRRRWIFLALSLLWMAVIFYFSGQSGSESGALSGFLSELLGLPDWVVRKGAHMAEYAALGFFLAGFFLTFPGKRMWLPAWGTAVLYAASDEIHQMFSDGRGPAVRDVCIDAAGAVIGVAAMCLITVFFRRRRNKPDE